LLGAELTLAQFKRTYDFILTFHSNYGHVLYSFQDKVRYRPNIEKFSYPVYLMTLLRGSLWNFVMMDRLEKPRMIDNWGRGQNVL